MHVLPTRASPAASWKTPSLDISLVKDRTLLRAPEVERVWRRLGRQSSAPHAFRHSPEWFEHRLRAEPEGELLLAMLRDRNGDVSGVSPILVEDRQIEFAIGQVMLHTQPLKSAVVLGGVPLLPDDPRAHDELFHAIASELPDCEAVELELVPRDSFAYRHITTSPEVREHFYVYEPEAQGKGPVHVVRMPPSFEAYLHKFSAKTRSKLRRRVTTLHDQRRIELVRYDAPGTGTAFLEAATRVAEHTWQRRLGDRFESGSSWPNKLVDLADHGLLRSFVLFAGDQPCAFVLGIEHDGVLHYTKPGFDDRYAKFSPGAVLLYLMLEDLFRERTPHTVCFCQGDAPYKRFYANAQIDKADVLLLRRGLSRRLLMACHTALRAGVETAKRLLQFRHAKEANHPCRTMS